MKITLAVLSAAVMGLAMLVWLGTDNADWNMAQRINTIGEYTRYI